MDALLPSEIARLVLGYLQEQKCESASKAFMDGCPLLHECKLVAQRGGRYSTKVGGLSLTNILDKYCAANAIIQEKLNKASDSEQMKNCNDITDQLRYLLEGTRGNRFVVNINVPSQNSPNGSFGSPVVSGSSRKRHHSHSDRGKKVAKSLNLEKSGSDPSQHCSTVDATPLESLPGHKSTTKQNSTEAQSTGFYNKSHKLDHVNNSKESRPNDTVLHGSQSGHSSIANSTQKTNGKLKNQLTETVPINGEVGHSTCTAGTSTDELVGFCSTEVQTAPNLSLQSESEVHDEPLENLSIFTKKLLERTEIHERIAETINRVILPAETSMRDESVRSAVECTESDPMFEELLKEIFTTSENDASPDEGPDRSNQASNDQFYTQNEEPMDVDNVQSLNSKIKGSEVQLKQRLRSSSRSQNTNDEGKCRDSNSTLENQNAEAILNIVNVITSKKDSSETNEAATKEVPSKITSESADSIDEPQSAPNTKKVVKNPPRQKRKYKMKPRPPKPPPPPIPPPESVETLPLIVCSENVARDGFLPIMPKPITESPLKPGSKPLSALFFRTVQVPRHLVNPAQIEASKLANSLIMKFKQQQQQQQQQEQASSSQQTSPTNNKPTDVNTTSTPDTVTDDKGEPSLTTSLSETTTTTTTTASEPAAASASAESITLYVGSDENDGAEVEMAPIETIPIINVDDTMMMRLTAATGLSPFFKGSTSPVAEVEKPEVTDEAKIEQNVPEESDKANENVNAPDASCESLFLHDQTDEGDQKSVKSDNSKASDGVFTRRTPKTLLRSRSKNNRLSLSTPRRRNSHVRALDFGTPEKGGSVSKKLAQSAMKTKSVCRAGLFKSPPFSGSTARSVNLDSTVCEAPTTTQEKSRSVKKVRTLSPVKPTYLSAPIATRSPVPKLQGNWNKVAGIGMILGETSASESSPEKSQTERRQASDAPIEDQEVSAVSRKSWDSYLRSIVGSPAVREEEKKEKPKSTRGRKKKITTPKAEEKGTRKTPQGKRGSAKKASDKSEVDDESADEALKTEVADETPANTSVKIVEPVKITPPPAKKPQAKASAEDRAIENSSISKQSPESHGPTNRISQMLDLKTPCKPNEPLLVPPTPCVVMATPGVKQILRTVSGKHISIKDCVNTPDFPPTPCIVHTPKIIEEDDDEKKASPYYEPAEEQAQAKEVVVAEKVVLVVKETKVTMVQKNVVELQENRSVEITKFGVVGENKAQEEEEDEEEMTSEENSKETIGEESVDDTNASANSDSDNESDSDSDSSSSSSSSNSSSSSDSSSSSSSASSPTKSVIEPQDNSTTESEMESPPNSVKKMESKVEREEEISPIKSPPCAAVDELSEGEILDTPVKDDDNPLDYSFEPYDLDTPIKTVPRDEMLLSDGEILDTPVKEEEKVAQKPVPKPASVSLSNRAHYQSSVTNLTSVISATLKTSQSSVAKETTTVDKILGRTTTKSKIVNVQRIVPAAESTTQQVAKVSEEQQQQQQAINQANLSMELEEKRRRMVAKFKEAEYPFCNQPRTSSDSKQKKVAANKKNSLANKIVSTLTDSLRSKNKPTVKSVEELKSSEQIIVRKVEAKVDEKTEVKKTEVKKNDDVKKVEVKQPAAVKKEVKKQEGLKKAESKRNEDVKKEDLNRIGNRVSPRKKTVQEKNQVIKTENKEEKCQKKLEKETVVKNVAKDVPVAASTTKSLKAVVKNKVDQVKRDLFSDEENNDQRTTRSQTARRTVDPQKNNENVDINRQVDSAKEKIPGAVLECLQLIPTSKHDQQSRDVASKNANDEELNSSQGDTREYSFTYDESIPIKKRKREYNNPGLENEYSFQHPEDDEPVKLKPSPCQEIFKMAPTKKTQSPKKTPVKVRKNTKDAKIPLATSSPLVKNENPKNEKFPANIKSKATKRKPSPVKESKPVEKKRKPDPQALFKKINVDEFLKSVHVSKK